MRMRCLFMRSTLATSLAFESFIRIRPTGFFQWNPRIHRITSCFLPTLECRRGRLMATNRQQSRMMGSTSNDPLTAASSSHPSDIYQKKYRFSGKSLLSSKNSGATVTFTTGHTIQTDLLPVAKGGTNHSPQPVELLLAAWVGCTQATALFVSRNIITSNTTLKDLPITRTSHRPNSVRRRSKIILERLEFVDMVAIRDERGAIDLPVTSEAPPISSRIHTIRGTVLVYAHCDGHPRHHPFDPSLMELWKSQTEVRCPIANMLLASGCEIDVRWVDANTLPHQNDLCT